MKIIKTNRPKGYLTKRNFAESDITFGKQLAKYYDLLTFSSKFDGLYDHHGQKYDDKTAADFSLQIMQKLDEGLSVEEILTICSKLDKKFNIKLKLYHGPYDKTTILQCEWACPDTDLYGVCHWECEIHRYIPLLETSIYGIGD